MDENEVRPSSMVLIQQNGARAAPHACIEINRGLAPTELYARGYFEASIDLVERCASNALPCDTVFYPSVHLFRHGLELAFKSIERSSSRRNQSNSKPATGHSLDVLWKSIRDELRLCFLPHEPALEPEWTQLRVEDVDEVIAQLTELDARGEAFRYDTDRKGSAYLDHINSVDLIQLRDVIKFVSHGVMCWLHRVREMEAYYLNGKHT